jgi:protein-disulfide isomerase
MHRPGSLLLFALTLASAASGCAAHSKTAATPADLEERVRKLEADNAKYAEALAFLQQVYDQQVAQRQAQEDREPAPGAIFAVPVADAVAAGQVAGPSSAPVTIVKAFDFACPYCAELNTVLDEIVSEYNGKVRVVYENMVVHPFAMAAHLGGCAAGKQGKYLAFKKVIWERSFVDYASARDPQMLDEAHVVEAGKTAGLDTAKMQRDLASEECKSRIAADMRELERFGVNGTPTLFINGSMLTTGTTKANLRSAIDEHLKVATSSGVAGSDYYAKEVVGKGEKQFRSKSGK